MDHYLIISTVVTATIFLAILIKKRIAPDQEAQTAEIEEDSQNESSAEEESPESNSDTESINQNFLKLIGIPAKKNPRNRRNSIKGENVYTDLLDLTRTWELVGIVERLYMYPIEGGSKIRIPKIHCSSIGPSELGRPALLRDRCLVVFSVNPSSNTKIMLLDDPKLRVITISLTDTTIHIDSPDSDLGIKLCIHDIFHVATTEVKYVDGSIINVLDCGDEASEFLTRVISNNYENTPRLLRLGWVNTATPRGLKHLMKGKTLSGKEKIKHSLEALLPTYSACTVVNEASVNSLKNEIGKTDLTHDYFRPHIVITGRLPEYSEDKIKIIRIGSTVLSNKLPCIQNINVNTNPSTGNLSLDEEPYRTLSKIRPLANIYSEYNSNEPIFGINMKVISEGAITEGDKVFVQWQ